MEISNMKTIFFPRIFRTHDNKISFVRILIFILVSIFFSGLLMMIFQKIFPSIGSWGIFIIYSIFLSVILLPVLYYRAYRVFDVLVEEHMKEEEKTRKSEEKLSKLFSIIQYPVAITRLSDNTYISVNDGFREILGYAAEEVIGKTAVDLKIFDDPEALIILTKKLNEDGIALNFRTDFRKKDGTLVKGLLSASMIDLDGIPHKISVLEDITKRINLEDALLLKQIQLEAIIDSSPDQIYFKDRNSKFVVCNDAVALMAGCKFKKDLIGKSDFDFHPHNLAKQYYEDEQILMNNGQPFLNHEEMIMNNSTGEIQWNLSSKVPVKDTEGKVIGLVGVNRDITEKKRSDELLTLLANALKSINDCVSITDLNDKVLFINDAFHDIYGFNETDFKDNGISIISSPNNPHSIISEIAEATRKGGWKGELLNCRKNGEEFPIYLSTSIVKNNEDRPIALIGVSNDITIRKRMEMESEILFEITQGVTTTSNLDELLKLIHQSLGKIMYAENCFVALYDQESGLFNFPYFVDKLDPAPTPSAMEKSCSSYVFRNIKPVLINHQLFNQLRDDKEIELIGSDSPSWIGVPLQTPTKVIGVLVLQHYEKENIYSEGDLRFLVSVGSQVAMAIERKKAEKEIILKNEMLQSINAEKDKLFSIIGHDLKGPMSAFVQLTQILTEDIDSMTSDEIKDIMLSMKTDASNLYRLLENLLEWSRLKRGALEFKPEKLNLKKIFKTSIDVNALSARSKNIEIFISAAEDIEATADAHMLETILRNLVSNAVKFTPEKGRIVISASNCQDGQTEIAISDSGIGIPAELKSKLFIINEKTGRVGTAGEASTGLGLLICKEFVEKLGGRIWAESEEGKGSTFRFTVP